MSLSLSARSRLEYQHQTIRDLIRNIPEETLRRRIHPDKWSAFENIAHLAAYQPIFLQRLERMQNEPEPQFDRYVADQDPQFASTIETPLEQLLADIDDKRVRLIARLKGMDAVTLDRMGIHPKYGRFAIKEWTEFFLLHEAHHLYTIFMLVQDLHKGL
jgi:uncharacterized damage-inducible protein DinB